jgi:hypothetical protein
VPYIHFGGTRYMVGVGCSYLTAIHVPYLSQGFL